MSVSRDGESNTPPDPKDPDWLEQLPSTSPFVAVLQRELAGPDNGQLDTAAGLAWLRSLREGAPRHEASEHETVSPPRQPRRHSTTRWYGVGVSALASLGVALLGLARLPHRHSSESLPSRSYSTRAQQIATITLRDGSRVTLAPASRLLVRRDEGGRRVVSLEGEAYFEVVAAQTTPFIVSAGRTVTQVLGTAFDVRCYPHEASVRVAVTSGKVAVGAHNRAPVTLVAGHAAQVTDSTATVSVIGDRGPYTGWMQGRLVFADVPVTEMLSTVERWYGFRFHLADATLGRERVTATFDHKSAEQVLAALRTLLAVSMTFEGNTVTLHPQDVHPRGRPPAPNTPRQNWRDSLTTMQTRENGR